MWFLPKRNKRGLEEARLALEEAQKVRNAIEKRGERVHRLVQEIESFTRPNHFAERLQDLIIRPAGRFPHDS